MICTKCRTPEAHASVEQQQLICVECHVHCNFCAGSHCALDCVWPQHCTVTARAQQFAPTEAASVPAGSDPAVPSENVCHLCKKQATGPLVCLKCNKITTGPLHTVGDKLKLFGSAVHDKGQAVQTRVKGLHFEGSIDGLLTAATTAAVTGSCSGFVVGMATGALAIPAAALGALGGTVGGSIGYIIHNIKTTRTPKPVDSASQKPPTSPVEPPAKP